MVCIRPAYVEVMAFHNAMYVHVWVEPAKCMSRNMFSKFSIKSEGYFKTKSLIQSFNPDLLCPLEKTLSEIASAFNPQCRLNMMQLGGFYSQSKVLWEGMG